MNILQIQNLNIQFEDKIVLEGFSKEFKNGLHWIQGHNGSGKSTLLKSICGILPVEANIINILDNDLNRDPIKAKSFLSYVPDKPDVYPFMTGLQYLKFIAKIKNTEISEELYGWLNSVHLDKYLDTEFSQMSFGTKRKFTLSSIFIGNPKLILLDEPFNGLDKNSINHFNNWLTRAKKDKCILIVSHDSHILDKESDSSIMLG